MNIITLISRKRWSKRLFKRWLPPIHSAKLKDGFEIYYNPLDMQGPSFHFSYDLDRGFYNYEQEDRDFLLSLCEEQTVLYDVGANIGLFSLYAAKTRPDIIIHAFEPDPETYHCLELSKQNNQLNQLTLHPFGLGLEQASLPLYQHHSNDGGHSLIPPENAHQDQAQTVMIKSLDDCLQAKLMPPPQVIKIDVEGFEADCLMGMQHTILNHRPSLMVECLNASLNESHQLYKIFREFEAQGARFYSSHKHHTLNLKELAQLAQSQLVQGKTHDNYFILFNVPKKLTA